MRTIEDLAKLYPEKTGKELFEIQDQDKLEDEKTYQKHNETKLKWIEDINNNGGFFRGRFGIDQRFYYKVTNCFLECGRIMCDIEQIIVFLGCGNGVIKKGEANIKKEISEYRDADKYGLHIYERISEKDWGEINSYLEGIEKFWSNIKQVEHI